METWLFAMEIYEFTLLDFLFGWMVDGWLDGCVRVFPFIFSYGSLCIQQS